MDSVVDKLAEIEEAAEAIVRHAHDKKSDIEKELQKEREEFDRETEEKTRFVRRMRKRWIFFLKSSVKKIVLLWMS